MATKQMKMASFFKKTNIETASSSSNTSELQKASENQERPGTETLEAEIAAANKTFGMV